MAVPRVSVVVTVRNGMGSLQKLLECFDGLRWPQDRLEVVIVDAFSDDGTWEALQEWQKRAACKVVLAQKAGGIGAGRNEAFRLASAEWVAVTDADMRVPPDWIDELMAGTGDGVGVVGGPNDDPSPRWFNQASNAIAMHGPSKGEVPIFGRSRYRQDFLTRDDHFAAVTRNCLFRRSAFEAAGGFDESLITAEDGELNRRIMAAGYAIQYRRDAGVLHEHRPTLRGFWRQQRNYARGQAQANRKDPSMARLRHPLPAAALAAFLVLALVVALVPWLWPLLLALVGLAVAAALAYGIKAGAQYQRPVLAPAIGFLFLVWMLAWAIGYPEGRWRRRLLRGSHRED